MFYGTAPSTSDYDAYGVKFAANDYLVVVAANDFGWSRQIGIMFYNQVLPQSQEYVYCDQFYADPMYIFSVSVGMNQTADQKYFAYNGYYVGSNVSFIGWVNVTLDSNGDCHLHEDHVDISLGYDIGDYFVMTVDPNGQSAYGFATQFIVRYDFETQQETEDIAGYSSTSASYTSGQTTTNQLQPHAVAATDNYIILAAALDDSNWKLWTPTLYFIDISTCDSNSTVNCIPSWSAWPSWEYTPQSEWQMNIAESDDDSVEDYQDAYRPLYQLSVDINFNSTEILFGIQYFSTVVRLSVNFTGFQYIDQRTIQSGKSVGYGKSVKYSPADGSIAILANNYTFDYQTWYSSSIEVFDNSLTQNFNNSDVIPQYIFPNAQQPMWQPPLSSIILAIQMTSTGLVFIDAKGHVYMILNSPPGIFTDTSTGTGSFQIYHSASLACQSGTYKSKSGVNHCRLCSSGTFSSGNGTIECEPCSNQTSFCPLGSVSDTNSLYMTRTTQVRAYPESPDNTIFDDILILSMFSLDTSSLRCLVISPLFWALIIFGIVIATIVLMGFLKLFGRCKPVRRIVKKIFRSTDLIGEGELWMGGLASFAILILCAFAYNFSNAYLQQYPIETSSDSSFACDKSQRNAKFSSSLHLLAAADTSAAEQQEIFNFMNDQKLTLHVNFVNTLFQCNLSQTRETLNYQSSAVPSQCSVDTNNSVMSVNVSLNAQFLTIQFILGSNATIGGLNIALTGPGLTNHNYIVQELSFQEPFTVDSQTLTQSPTIEIQLIKVINITKSLVIETNNDHYSGLYIPAFVYDSAQVFYDEDMFNLYHTLSQTVLTVKITNSLYYIQNVQEPIARQSEIIFHNLLFTIVCIEIFGLIFLIFKLVLLPLFKFILEKLAKKSNRITAAEQDEDDEGEDKNYKLIDARVKNLESLLKSQTTLESNVAKSDEHRPAIRRAPITTIQMTRINQAQQLLPTVNKWHEKSYVEELSLEK